MVMTAPPRSQASPPPAAPAARQRRRRIRSASRIDAAAPYAYIAPFFALFAVFGLFPTVFTFYVALFDWNPIGGQTFIGLDNFVTLYGDERFWNAMRNTFSIWLLSTVPQLILALFLAQLLNNLRLKFANLFRMSMLVPYITSVVATTIVFASLFGRDYGLINGFLNLFGVESIDFSANTAASHIMVSTMVLWRWFGYNTLIYLAALQAIPERHLRSSCHRWRERLQTVLLCHDSLASPGHHLHGDRVDDRWAPNFHRTAAALLSRASPVVQGDSSRP